MYYHAVFTCILLLWHPAYGASICDLFLCPLSALLSPALTPRRTRGCFSPDRMGRIWLRLLGLVCVPFIQPCRVRKLLDNHSNLIEADLPKIQTHWRLGPPDKIMSHTQMSGWLRKREHSFISSSGSLVCGRNEAGSSSLCLDLPFCIMVSACMSMYTQQHPLPLYVAYYF